MEESRQKLLIFAKAPIAGHAKSRMIPLLGAEGAAQLHREITRRLLRRLTNRLKSEPDYQIELWAASAIDHPFFEECSGEFGVVLKLQQGDDLGERQFLAMDSALGESDHVVIIGSDVVSLTEMDIKNAFNALQQGYELVISPAEDGGYGLIGGSRVERDIFDGIHWGAELVYKEITDNLNRLEYNWHQLAEVWDLDQPDDLIRLSREPDLPEGILELMKNIG
ncbi:MAG: DUF2064 domain-containing protein [Gammaproteobacteria bacterium]|nr:DUF2064 domain-containing protein [Gammaproteobacteria bacterium]